MEARSVAELEGLRRRNWGVTPETRIAGPEDAVGIIERLGVVTLFPASPEVPNLFHAYVGDPNAATSSKWDSPAGQVYGGRWDLGRREAEVYYLPGAVWVAPQRLARHLGLETAEVRAGLERRTVTIGPVPGGGEGYTWASV